MNHADRNPYTFSTFTDQLVSLVPFYMVGVGVCVGGGGGKQSAACAKIFIQCHASSH